MTRLSKTNKRSVKKSTPLPEAVAKPKVKAKSKKKSYGM